MTKKLFYKKMTFHPNHLLVLDLDDTLYSEYDFETSGIQFVLHSLNLPYSKKEKELLEKKLITHQRKIWVQEILQLCPNEFTSHQEILQRYHHHSPTISLYPDALTFLERNFHQNIPMVLVTDGKSITQRNKINALGISQFFQKIYISEEVGEEKLGGKAFHEIHKLWPNHSKVMIGDNPKKDFLIPNQLQWLTIQLEDRGQNIHAAVSPSIEHRAKISIENFDRLLTPNEI